MRSFLKKVINIFQISFFKTRIISIEKNSLVLVLDIDNTLADTWPKIKNNNCKSFHRDLQLLEGTKHYIDKNFVKYRRVFISHRKLSAYRDTKYWLRKNHLLAKNSRIILTRFPDDKFNYLSYFLKKKCKVVYIDDLSYNHENGKILYYDSIIKKVKECDIDYFDYSWIQKINSKN